MPNEIDSVSPNNTLKSALRSRSKYDEENSIEEMEDVDEIEGDLSDVSGSGDECDAVVDGGAPRSGGDFIDWDDVNDPDFIEINFKNEHEGTTNEHKDADDEDESESEEGQLI